MAEVMQVGSSVFTQSAYQSETHVQSAYCKELLMRGGEEFTFEELRAERYFQQRQSEMDERLRYLKEVKQQLSQELEEKKRLLLLRMSQVGHEAPCSQTRDSGSPSAAASSFQIYDESQSATARPSGDSELLDDVFLGPDERGLCLRVHCPPPGDSLRPGPDESVRARPGDDSAARLPQTVVQSQTLGSAPEDHRGTTKDLQTHPPLVPQKPLSKATNNLSPIEETSVEASSLTSLGEDQDQDQDQEMGCALSAGPVSGAMNPCDLDVRWQLLDCYDVTSSPGFHCESQPLPPVCNCLQLGGKVYRIYSRVVDGGRFSIYNGATEDDCVLIKVDNCRVPWDLHQFNRLKKSSSTATNSLPLISCFLFLDGCITIYTSLPDHMFTELTECVSNEVSVSHKAVGLLQLVSQLHSCGLVHAALQPSTLTCSHGGFMNPEWVFPVDWSFSVDLDLQQDVTSVQQLPSAQTYIRLGLLEPTAPPQLLDLVGVAETVHLLLTNSKMLLVRDGAGWTAEQFSGDKTCNMFSRMWRSFFRSLLNASGRSSSSILSELREQLSTLYQ